jgi:Tol biopolymer transport system component
VSTRLTFDAASNGFPVWSPDGSHVAFRSNRSGKFDLYQKPSNGAGDDELLVKSDEDKVATDWSRDGRFLMFTANSAKTNMDLWILPLGSPRGSQPAPLLRTESFEGYASFSPDSRWIAYTSSESGRPEVYVRPFKPPGSAASSTEDQSARGKWQVSRDGAVQQQPRWRSDGKELYYLGRQTMMAVDVSTAPIFRAGNPQPLFRLPVGPVLRWDATADGKRFLVPLPTDTALDSEPITVVLNWTARLQK